MSCLVYSIEERKKRRSVCTPDNNRLEHIIRELKRTTITLWIVLGIGVFVVVLLIIKTSDLSDLVESMESRTVSKNIHPDPNESDEIGRARP